MASNKEYKLLHESFVSNHTGTSLIEVAMVMSVPVASVFLNSAFMLLLRASWMYNSWLSFLVEFPCLVLPFLLAVTTTSESVYSIFFTILALSTSSILYYLYNIPKTLNTSDLLEKIRMFPQCEIDKRLSFISNFKAYTLIGTVVAILAVDFTIFPRRFCKTETYGTGLMDVGVGLFIMSNAIVSPEARSKENLNLHRTHQLYKSILSSIPLFIFGIARVLATKGVDYHEHVTEYGSHWNFFFTLATVKILASVQSYIIPVKMWKYVAVLLCVVYQYLLSYRGGSQYILQGLDGKGGRSGILDSNREGIISNVGYFILYLFGVEVGRAVFSKERKTVSEYLSLFSILTLATVVTFLTLPLIIEIEPVSRRFANVPYVLWMLGMSLQLVVLNLLLDLVFLFLKNLKETKDIPDKKKMRKYSLIDAVNYNGLIYFLVANLLTGLINLNVKTILVPSLYSVIIIVLYMMILSIFAYVLYIFNVKMKFW